MINPGKTMRFLKHILKNYIETPFGCIASVMVLVATALVVVMRM